MREKVRAREREGREGGARERETERDSVREWIEKEREKGKVQDMNTVNMSHVSFVPYISIHSVYTLPAFKGPRL